MVTERETSGAASRVIRLLWGAAADVIVIVWTLGCAFVALVGTLLTGRATAVDRLAPIWGRFILRVCGVQVDVEGIEKVDPARSYVILSNHLSDFDVWATLAALPLNLRFVAKQELRKFPLLGAVLDRSEHIVIDRSRPELAIARINERMARRGSTPFCILFYAEGTRSPDGRIQPFKKGAVTLALRTGLPVVPLAISGTRKLLPKRVPLIRPGGRVKIVLSEPIETAELSLEQRDELNERVRDIICRNYDPQY